MSAEHIKTITVRADVDFCEFTVPNFAVITVGESDLTVPLANLSHDALDQMAGVWLERLYAKCSRDMPCPPPPTGEKI